MTSDELARAVLGPVELELFENAYAAYAAEAQVAATRLVGDRVLAVDAVHDAYLQILRELLGGRRWYEPAAARSTVLRHVRWASLKLLRARSRRREHDVPLDEALVPAAVDGWARWETRTLCRQILARLPDSQREALHLRFIEGLGETEAARRLGIGIDAYRQRSLRGLTAARRLARGWGVSPVALLLLRLRDAASHRSVSAARRRVATRARTAIPAVLTTATTISIAAATLGWLGGGWQPSPAPAAAQLSAMTPRPGIESLADTQVLSIAAAGAPVPGTLLAFGEGTRCGCRVLFRSLDRGGSWQEVAWPGGQADDLAGAAHGMPALEPVDSRACEAVRGGVACLGHVVGGLTEPDLSSPGWVAIDAGVLVYAIPGGGAMRSVDGGATWSRAGP